MRQSDDEDDEEDAESQQADRGAEAMAGVIGIRIGALRIFLRRADRRRRGHVPRLLKAIHGLTVCAAALVVAAAFAAVVLISSEPQIIATPSFFPNAIMSAFPLRPILSQSNNLPLNGKLRPAHYCFLRLAETEGLAFADP